MDDLYTNFTISILRLNKLVQKIKIYEMNKHDLKPIHVSCGYFLYRNPQGLTAKELGEMSLEDKAAISRALQTLQQRGYVQYVHGGRNEIVQLTDEGKKLTADIAQRITDAVNACSANIKEDERVFLYNSLFEIAENLTNYYKKLTKSEGETNE
ncbi:MAG: MarR family winged helix-turn-helix transcriptional regulator [Clostridia bacterium]|nr:MarR family winged helix-turn-helix transcriptional regulator [Clostridia bacterium]